MKSYFTLRELMYAKYGEERFALACEIVSMWLQHDTKGERYTAEWVANLCNSPISIELERDAREALMRLFGLRSAEELFAQNVS